MRQNADKASRVYVSSSLRFVPVVLVATLALAGCSKTRNQPEPGSAASPTAVSAQAGRPKLVDLGATQCIPCKMMAPVLEELEKEYAGVMDVEFIDVWQPKNQNSAKSYGIEEIPTQIFLAADGKELWRHVGFIAKEDILAKWSELGYNLKPGTGDHEHPQEIADP